MTKLTKTETKPKNRKSIRSEKDHESLLRALRSERSKLSYRIRQVKDLIKGNPK